MCPKQGFLNFFGIAECCYIYKNFAGGCYTFLEKCCYVFFKVAKNFETLIATLKKSFVATFLKNLLRNFFKNVATIFFAGSEILNAGWYRHAGRFKNPCHIQFNLARNLSIAFLMTLSVLKCYTNFLSFTNVWTSSLSILHISWQNDTFH